VSDHAVQQRDSAGNKTLSIGPMTVDGPAEVTARLGTHNKAHQLLQRHAQMFPAALRTQLARPIDGDRTAFLQNDAKLLDAVRDAALAVSGRRRFLDEEDVLESASVHGDELSGRIVALLYRTGSGRSARGVLSYDAVPAIERAFQSQVAKPAQVREGDTHVHEGAADDSDRAELERVAQEAEAEQQRLAQEVEALRAEVTSATNPEPFPGYDELNAEDVRERIRTGGYKEFGTAGLERIEEYEESQAKPRKTVIEAVVAALDAVPPDDAPEE
jgi:hypothetical protein